MLLTLTALFWAGNAIVGRAARELVPPVALSFWRWSIALLLLLPLAWPHLKRDKAALVKAWPMVVLLGALGVGSFNTLLYSALQHTTAINSLLLQAAQPALILGLGALAFGDATTRAQIAGVLLSLIGVLTIVSTGDPQVLLKLRLNIGDAIMALAIAIWATYSVLLRKRPEVHPLSFLAASLMTGVAIILPFYIAELAFGRRIIWQPNHTFAHQVNLPAMFDHCTTSHFAQ
jgi:drug/metabolite transporter (DMT)-like permease